MLSKHTFKENRDGIRHNSGTGAGGRAGGWTTTADAQVTQITRLNIKDAVAGFLNTAEEQGTPVQILEEAGYRLEGGRWREPEIVSTERMQVRVA